MRAAAGSPAPCLMPGTNAVEVEAADYAFGSNPPYALRAGWRGWLVIGSFEKYPNEVRTI